MESTKRVAIITGGASGIGFALAEVCLQQNFEVALVDVDESNLTIAVDQLSANYSNKVLGFPCDVTKLPQIQSVASNIVAQFKRIDWLFNNAGIFNQLAPIWELDNDHIKQVLDVNLFGVINSIKAFLPTLFIQPFESRIINMSSFYGLCSTSQAAPYAMSKHGILALSESLYFDLQRLSKPVQVSVVCPSFTNTALLKNVTNSHNAGLNLKMAQLFENARPASVLAKLIIDGVQQSLFYILPDAEVKNYCAERTTAIVQQQPPLLHNMETLLRALNKRSVKLEKHIDV